jgi:multidrug efflux system outer membrane protein
MAAVPAELRGALAAPDPAASIADTKWQDLFADQTLNQMVTTALAHNFDLRIAVERVQQARAQLGIASANKYPFVDIGGFHRGA